MALKNGETIYKWIDLSCLPRDSRNRIIWKESIGADLHFVYGTHTGTIKILEYDNVTNKAVVFIDGYTDNYGKSIGVDQLKVCSLGNILKKAIALTHPYLVQYFINKDDTLKYSAGSGKEIQAKCPFCGHEKTYRINDLCRKGFSCPVCSDGKSWPEKFMYNILQQLKVFFINEVTRKNNGFEWVAQYRYDFYFEKDNCSYMIEMDGGMHFNDYFRPHEEAHAVDLIKDKLAESHNITMIRIDCNYTNVASRFEFIKNNILNSMLQQILDLSLVNWDAANNAAMHSNVVLVSKMWDSGIHDKKKIANEIGISIDTVENYLQLSEKSKLSTYNKIQDKINGVNRTAKALSKPVMLFENGIAINVFPSTIELDRRSMELYGVHLYSQHVGDVCRGNRRSVHNYTMKYITFEEYEQFSTIQN